MLIPPPDAGLESLTAQVWSMRAIGWRLSKHNEINLTMAVKVRRHMVKDAYNVHDNLMRTTYVRMCNPKASR